MGSMNNSINVEKLLMERVMLRKEMKLRSVQMLVDTSHKLEQAEERLEEYESLPLFRQYPAWCGVVRWWQEEAGVVRRGVLTGLSLLYQMFLAGLSLPCFLFHQLPASLQLLCLSFVTQLASVVRESAELHQRVQGEKRGHQGLQQIGTITTITTTVVLSLGGEEDLRFFYC